jgi:UDP-2,3-diacylglucosamine pyrophosphatase LpxH
VKKKYKSIFISDVHLGTKASQAEKLCKFLKENTCENLYLVGDIIDAWRLQRKWYFPQEHANVIRRIITAAKRDTAVWYILGNHDEFLRKYIKYNIEVGNVKIVNQTVHQIGDKKYLVIHGDFFDPTMNHAKWLMHIGDIAYNLMIWVNLQLNWIRKKLKLNPWGLSKFLKSKTKEAINFIGNYETQLSEYCKKHGYDGIICGHIHTPANKMIDGIHYINTGDWVENSTAIVEHFDGRLELIDNES